MNTIERTQNEVTNEPEQGALVCREMLDVTANAAAKILPLAEWELMHASGGENTGTW